MNRMEFLKKGMRILLIGVAVLVAGAILLGVVNAVFADGKWTFGWTDYNYGDEGFSVGDGTVASDRLTSLEIDWIDGTVEILPCNDTYLSLTEKSPDGELSDGSRLRYRMDADGGLTVKYRKSGFFFGSSQMLQKQLTVRVPVQYLRDLSVTVNGKAVTVILNDADVNKLSFNSESGNLAVLSTSSIDKIEAYTKSGKILVSGVVRDISASTRAGEIKLESLPQIAEIENERGDVKLRLPKAASFTLDFETEKGRYISDFDLQDKNGFLVCGSGNADLSIKVDHGVLYLIGYN